MFRVQSSRGAAFVWRQGDGDLPLPGTLAPRPKWQLRARGARAFVWRSPANSSTPITIAGTVGNAVAAGVTGATSQAITIAATVGNAVAAGVTGEATVGFDISIDGIVGNAVAAGVSGSASVSGSGTGATAAEIWAYTLTNGLTAEQTLVAVHAMLLDLHLIHGLTTGSPLSVTTAARAAGAVTQTIADNGTTVTVTRQ
ncbi:MAG: hypothetical protein RL375_2533 [Pseudomonadota bacterium]|jgi:hypothetical protein